MQGAGGVGGLLAVSEISNGQISSLHFAACDGNGNVSSLVSASDGTVSGQYEYGPFGELLRATGPMAKANPFRWSSKFEDDETDLLYYGYRYYCASTGRWISRDPATEIGADTEFAFWDRGVIDDDGDSNPYRFVVNEPTVFIDRFGLATGTKPTCGCKCKGLTISYTPKLKDGKLTFDFYKNPNTKRKQYGFILHVYWTVEGDGSLCTYAVNEPSGGVTGSDPQGPTQPSSGTGGLWHTVPQKWDDHPGVPVDLKGIYSIDVNLTQTYACWDAGLDANTQPPSATIGPMFYTGSGTGKY
jgi:RHS repeat-associated protein